MKWLIGSACLFWLAAVLTVSFLFRLIHRRVLALERAVEVDLATACRVKPAEYLGQRLADLCERETLPILVGAVKPNDASLAGLRNMANLLRKVAIQGVDEIFIEGPAFWIVVMGRLDPFRVGHYFQNEIRAHELRARCSWAYTASPEHSIRSELRAKAGEGLLSPRATEQVVAVLPDGAPIGYDEGKISDPTFEERRACTGLTRSEFAAAVGHTRDTVVAWETGRSCPAEVADELHMRLGLIEKACHSAGLATGAGR